MAVNRKTSRSFLSDKYIIKQKIASDYRKLEAIFKRGGSYETSQIIIDNGFNDGNGSRYVLC